MPISKAVKQILKKRNAVPDERSIIVGISGIDASGKGFITKKLAAKLNDMDCCTAIINADAWLNLPHIRFTSNDTACNFYENAIRLDEMFARLVLPLGAKRSIRLIADFAEETATEFSKHEYCFENIDVILLEGIFLFKKKYQNLFDLKIWVECSFETALERAVKRSQEGLSEVETVRAYKNVYFPAQRIHFENDEPMNAADFVVKNDK